MQTRLLEEAAAFSFQPSAFSTIAATIELTADS
jgi:hypothetical protein